MLTSSLLSVAIAVLGASAFDQGFNYPSVFTDNSPVTQSDYESRFSTAQQLVGTSGFTSARLFTMIQAGTTNTPTEAIPAAISTKTSLLLGLFLSSTQEALDNEKAALSSAISQYGSAFLELVVGISVGSEDLYRISPIGIENMSGAGDNPDTVVDAINQVRSTISGTAASNIPVGHVDTFTAWINGSNSAVIDAVDFIGMDAYPYFQNTEANSIDVAESLFFEAYNETLAVSSGKPVWITETGWPVSGPTENQAVASVANAQTYWDQVGCSIFGKYNAWWFTLQDAFPTSPSPSFGIVGDSLSTTALFNLTCPAGSSSSSSSSSSTATSTVTSLTASVSASPSSVQASATSASASVSTPSGSISSAVIVSGSVTSGSSAAPATLSLTTPSASAASVLTVNPFTTLTTFPMTYTSGSATLTSTTTSTVTLTSSSTTSTASTTPSSTASACPASLSGVYEFPHLIVPVDKTQPTTAFGTSYNGQVSSTVSSLYNFDIPSSYAGKTCTIVFLFPTRDQLTTSNYTISGSGDIDVARLSSPALANTTYDTTPTIAADLGTIKDVQPGNSYVVSSRACAAGSRVGYEVSATGSLDLEYFQDYNPSPIGLYVVVC